MLPKKNALTSPLLSRRKAKTKKRSTKLLAPPLLRVPTLSRLPLMQLLMKIIIVLKIN
jgi:hypothetical protein